MFRIHAYMLVHFTSENSSTTFSHCYAIPQRQTTSLLLCGPTQVKTLAREVYCLSVVVAFKEFTETLLVKQYISFSAKVKARILQIFVFCIV